MFNARRYGMHEKRQAGAQKFEYSMFFMDAASLEYLKKSEGWELGVGPSIVFVDAGLARTLSTSTAKEGLSLHFQPEDTDGGTGTSGNQSLQDQSLMDPPCSRQPIITKRMEMTS